MPSICLTSLAESPSIIISPGTPLAVRPSSSLRRELSSYCFIMQSYQSSGFSIWTVGLEGEDVFLYDDKAGGAFAVQNFDSLDEAHKIYKALKQHPHPNFSEVLPPFEVGKVALLAWKKEGKSIDDFTKQPGGNRKFSGDDH